MTNIVEDAIEKLTSKELLRVVLKQVLRSNLIYKLDMLVDDAQVLIDDYNERNGFVSQEDEDLSPDNDDDEEEPVVSESDEIIAEVWDIHMANQKLNRFRLSNYSELSNYERSMIRDFANICHGRLEKTDGL